MPPRGIYKAKQEEKKKQNRSPRPAQESRSDRKEKERQETVNAQRVKHILRLRKAKQDDAKKKQVAKSSPQHAFQQRVGQSFLRDPRDNQNQPSGTSAGQRFNIKNDIKTRADKINNAVTTTAKAKMSPPIKPSPFGHSPNKFTIKGGQIKSGTIYKDELTGSTLAGLDTRLKAISDPKSVKVMGSRTGATLLQARPDMDQTKLYNTQQKISSNNMDVVDRLIDPSRTKVDFLTGKPTTSPRPSVLLSQSRKRNKRNMAGGNWWSSMLRSLLG